MSVHRFTRVALGAILVGGAACAGNNKPRVFGDTPALAPALSVKSTDSTPPTLALNLPRAAYIQAFLVTPGGETAVLYPADSGAPTMFQTGSHEIPLYPRRNTPADTGRILRAPTGNRDTTGRGGRGGQAGQAQGQMGRGGYADFAPHRYVMIYASEKPIPYGDLRRRVLGYTVPGYDNEALDTVAKMVRSLAPTGEWAAVAVEFFPGG